MSLKQEVYVKGLNVPFGARCYLALGQDRRARLRDWVLMHLLALGAC